MAPGGADETDKMAKKQKYAYLDHELCRMVELFQDRSGSSFSRVITAAILQFLLGDGPSWPETRWMVYAAKLERGEKPGAMTIGQIMKDVGDAAKAAMEAEIELARADSPENPFAAFFAARQNSVSHLLGFARLASQEDPVASLAEGWDKFAAGRPPLKDMFHELADDGDKTE